MFFLILMMANPVVQKLLQKIGDPQLIDKLAALPPTELQSLLLELHNVTAQQVTPGSLLKAYGTNRFVSPSALNPILLHQAESKLLELAVAHQYEPLELSPLAPLGTCSAVGLANQNKIVTASRGTEVVADATNSLALETAVRRKQQRFDGSVVKLCACHRHVRAQALPAIKGFTSHFEVFCAVSAGRDEGDRTFEAKALEDHLSFYQVYLVQLHGLEGVSFTIKGIRRAEGDTKISQQLFEVTKSRLPHVKLSFEEVNANDHRYYQHTRFSVNLEFEGKVFNLGDGGFVDWGTKLTSNAKERMFTSGIGLELLLKIQHRLI